MSWINICDVPLSGDYKVELIKGFVTMFVIFVLGLCAGRISTWGSHKTSEAKDE